jgi:DNA-binding MarR family transcriptional regulator
LTNQGLHAWARYIRGHAALTRELNAELVQQHGLTLNDYEVLLRLSHAEHRAMRRVDLAREVLLTASGITRLLDGLERAGWVCKKSCDSDARVTYAELTDAGYEKLSEAADFHLEGVRRAFAAHYTDEELETLADLLSRLGGDADGGGCSPPQL